MKLLMVLEQKEYLLWFQNDQNNYGFNLVVREETNTFKKSFVMNRRKEEKMVK